jgi:holo-[acyl-carrier protein] synthase
MTGGPAAIRHGVDLVEVRRLREVMERHARFEEAVFTDSERAYCRRRPDPYPHFAARFAAKEATLKALHRGLFGEGSDRALKEIEVVREDGPPRLLLHGAVAKAAERAGCDSPALSLSHDGGFALASVMWLEGAPR